MYIFLTQFYIMRQIILDSINQIISKIKIQIQNDILSKNSCKALRTDKEKELSNFRKSSFQSQANTLNT